MGLESDRVGKKAARWSDARVSTSQEPPRS
jgi:hypothetical protein